MLINLRNALMSGKRTPTAKDYVQDGLVAMWDGIENAGWGTHDPNATTWKDLVTGVYDLEPKKITAAWESDCALLQRFSQGGWYTKKLVLPSFVELVFQLTGTPVSGSYESLFCTYGSVHSGRKSAQAIVSGSGTLMFGKVDDFRLDISDRYNDRLSVSGPTAISVTAADAWYFCGQCVETPSGTVATNGSPQYLFIGGGWFSMTGRVFSARFYSRALTADEVAANYAVDKARFDLPDAT